MLPNAPARNERAISLTAKLRLLRAMTETMRGMMNTTDTMDNDGIRKLVRCAIDDADNIMQHLDGCIEVTESMQ